MHLDAYHAIRQFHHKSTLSLPISPYLNLQLIAPLVHLACEKGHLVDAVFELRKMLIERGVSLNYTVSNSRVPTY